MMSWDLSSIILQLSAWLLATLIVGVCLNRLMKHNALPASVWWCGLAITMLVFIPISSVVPVNIIGAYWVEGEYALTNVGRSISANIDLGTPITGYLATSILLLGIAVISLWRLANLYRDYTKFKRLITGAIPYYSDSYHYPAFITSLNASAFAMGVFRPVIALPDYFLSLPKAQQNILLEHECMHIKLGDTIAVVFWRVLCAVCWFNPFLKRLEAGINQSFELRCDEKTIKERQCSRIEYAQALLNCLALSTSDKANGLSLGFSECKLSLKDYKKRLKWIVAKPSHSNHLNTSLLWVTMITMVFGINSAFAAISGLQETWLHPVSQFNVSSEFGSIASIRGNKSHRGIDLVGPIGTPVYASASGKVMIADDTSLAKAYGNVVVIQHPKEWQSMYAHLSVVNVKSGQYVSQGDVIGLIGQSGRVTGPHLHFELAHQQQPVDPNRYLQKKGR